jgi:hypothetical protein
MSRFDTKDQQMLEEAYTQIQEGFWDRFKARGAGAMGAIKGMGQQIKGDLQKSAGSAVSGMGDTGKSFGDELSQKGQQNIEGGKVSGHNAKIEYLKKNLDKRIQKFVGGIKEDIQKLGLDIGNIEMISGINDALNNLKKSVNAPVATPPPLPQQEEPMDDETDDDMENPAEYSYPVKRKNSQPKAKQKPPVANPKKSKVNPNALKNRLARPEQEERFR